MAMNYTDEEYHQYTLEEFYSVEVKPNLFAVSRIFAEAHKQMNLAEYKAFTLALSHIDWTKDCPDTLYLDKKELAKAIGITSDPDHLSQDLARAIGQMPRHSFIEFSEKGKACYVSGNFVRTLALFRNVVRIRIEDEFLGLFGGLDGQKEVTKYITMWSEDIYGMSSERAVLFYELLRDNSDTRLDVNSGTVSIRKFKEMFNIPEKGKGSYTRNDENHKFNRPEFEKRVIDPLCDELMKTKMIQLLFTPEGKLYEKVKRGNRVIAYKFYWRLVDPKPLLESKEPEAEEVVVDDLLEPKELWISALDELKFSPEQIEAIRSRLILIPQSMMFDNGAAHGSLDLDRYHFMVQRVKDLKVEDQEKHIRSKFKYLVKILENNYLQKN